MVIVILIIGALLVNVSTVSAVPPLPSSFYGTVKVNGANVPDGTLIKASINGQVYSDGQTQTYQGDSVYALDVPGDDSSTTAIEGGNNGDTILFTIGGHIASQTGTWTGASNINLNLSITIPVSTVTPTLHLAQTVSTITEQITNTQVVEIPSTPTTFSTAEMQPIPTATLTAEKQPIPSSDLFTTAPSMPTTPSQSFSASPSKAILEKNSSVSLPTLVVIGFLVIVSILFITRRLIFTRKS